MLDFVLKTVEVDAVNVPVRGQNLAGAERDVVEVVNPAGGGRFVLVCEHASNFIPEEYKNLGLAAKVRKSHVAWDPGAIEVARALSGILDSPLVASRVSRLVYDCNRSPTVKSSVPARSEVFEIRGNLNLSKDKLDERARKYYFPFRNTLIERIGSHSRRVGSSILVSIHTFTPVFNGRRRSMELGVVHDCDNRMADGLLNALGQVAGMKVERNRPYGPRDGVTHTLHEHGTRRGIANVMIEIRNDLVATSEQQTEISALLGSAIIFAANNLNTRMG